MNVLSDFIVRVEEQYPLSIENEELNSLLTTIRNQAREIESLNKELVSMRLNIEHFNEEHRLREPAQPVEAVKAAEEAPAKKACRTRKPKAEAAEKPAKKAPAKKAAKKAE